MTNNEWKNPPHNSHDRRSFGAQQTRRYRTRRFPASVVLIVGALVVLLFVSVATGFTSNGDVIQRGVSIGEVEVGGMTKQEARTALERHTASRFDEVSFGEDGKFSVPGSSLGVSMDTEKSVEKAYAVGREGWFGERGFESIFSRVTEVKIPAAITYDEAAARETVTKLAAEVQTKPTNATFQLSPEGKVEVKGGEPGLELNQEKTLANLDAALDNMRSEVPLATIESGQPAVPAEKLEAGKPTKLLGSYETDYRWDKDPARRNNIEKVAEAMDGTVLAPGEVFSFNKIAIQQTYESAKVFSEGGTATEDGGGLCQTASTLYMAANYAGLEIVERHPHYTVLPYIRPGFDATVWFGYAGTPELDMQFKNTTDGYVYVREYIDEKGILRGEIYGQPTGKKVSMKSELVYRKLDKGIKFRTYKTVTQNGRVLQDGQFYDDIYSFPPKSHGSSGQTAPRVGGWAI